MAVARVFRSGNSQAVRLPKSFQMKGPEVEIFRRGDEIVLRERDARKKPLGEALFEALDALPLEMFEDIKETRPPEKRKGL